MTDSLQLPIVRPWLTEAEAKAAHDVVISGQVMQGPRVGGFEAAFAKYTGAAHALAVSNGTAALILALKAVGVEHGDVVVTVSHSFIATANAVRACGAEPVLLDIGDDDYNLDLRALETLLVSDCETRDDAVWYSEAGKFRLHPHSPLSRAGTRVGRVAAILAVHQIGMPCDMERLTSLASRFGIPIVEDAACAAGSKIRLAGAWEMIGRPIGAAACFSFHPRKLITTGDGGMITTNNPELFEHTRLLRQHGMSGVPGSGALQDSYPVTGFNYRLTDIQAAIGEIQLARLDEQVSRRRAMVEIYRQCLDGDRRFGIPVEPSNVYWNWQSLPVRFDPNLLDQAKLLAWLQNGNIGAKPGIMNAHEEVPYSGLWILPNSVRRRRDTIFVPLFHGMTGDDVNRVVQRLRDFAH